MELPFLPPVEPEIAKTDGLSLEGRPPGLVVYHKPRTDVLTVSWPGVHVNLPMMLSAEGVDVDWEKATEAAEALLACFVTARGNTLKDIYARSTRRPNGR